MKIGPNANPNVLKVNPPESKPVDKATADKSAKANVTSLAQVSPQAQQLESLQQELSALPDVDLERVNQVRAELKQGDFNVDLNELASAILNTHQRD